MSALMQSESSLERREYLLDDTDNIWNNLTLAQKFAASSLTQYGYELHCIRDSHDTHVAILTCDEKIAIISKAGEIETNSPLQIRE